MTDIDILIPTCDRPAALAVTLTSLCAQTATDFRIVISDQTEGGEATAAGEVQAVCRVLAAKGHAVATHRHLPRRGIAEQRQFLLEQATAPYVLYLDDDIVLEPWVVQMLWTVLQAEGCGFVGNSFIGLSHRDDQRPQEQAIAFWEGPVRPESVRPNTPAWERWRLHNAANLWHLQQAHGITPARPRRYKVAWVPGCVLFDRAKLLAVGGFSFWRQLPETTSGEDVMVQLRLMERYGGCGVLPSGAYHQELPTTIRDRSNDAHTLIPI